MLGLTLIVASIALADSINPSTLIPALFLARGHSVGRLASFTLGVFAVYLVGGLVLVIGPGRALIRSLEHVHGPVEHWIEAVGGVLVLAFAVVVWRSRNRAADPERVGRVRSRRSAFALGAGIMAIELPTAFVYFGAISAILAAHHVLPLDVSLVVAYNLLFVVPLLALLAAARFTGDRIDHLIASAGERLRYLCQLAVAGVAGIAGAALLAIGVVGLAAV
jgi:cytochrome c biogenesis protein CcdA